MRLESCIADLTRDRERRLELNAGILIAGRERAIELFRQGLLAICN